MKNRKFSILGAAWKLMYIPAEKDIVKMDNIAGYCDPTERLIVIYEPPADANVRNSEKVLAATVRHEVIHAYLFESGLGEEMIGVQGHNEQFIDWFALQAVKIWKTFCELGVAE